MSSIPLPENASLLHLRKQAKSLRRMMRDGDPAGAELVNQFHPRAEGLAAGNAASFALSDAQLTVARLYGFPSWPALRAHMTVIGRFSQRRSADGTPDDGADDADRFVALACLTYDPDDHQARVREAGLLLAGEPDLAVGSVAAMAVTGAHEALRERLAADERIATTPTGPNGWEPLLYCAYSRVATGQPSSSGLEAARVLLDAGADPNAGFLWRGLVPPFTALTGVIGGGERDEPPHAEWTAFARLLLEAGADPNDGQALYNNGLAGSWRDEPAHLELLLEHGLGTDRGGPWYQRLGGKLNAPEDLLYDELEVAAVRNMPKRMRLLLTLDLDLDRRVGRSRKTARRIAEDSGHAEVLAVLDEF